MARKKAPATREEQIARAEANLAKAQARANASAKAGETYGGIGSTATFREDIKAARALASAQTRLRNLREGKSPRRKTAHVPAGHANGGQFTGPGGNPPRAPRPGAETKKRRAAVVREQISAGVSEAKARRYAASVIPASPKEPKQPKPKARRERTPSEKQRTQEKRQQTKLRKELDEQYAYYQQVFGPDPSMTREKFDREYPKIKAQQKATSDRQKPKRARKRKITEVPRQGRRTRRNTQERVAVYSEARRGLHNRRARGA